MRVKSGLRYAGLRACLRTATVLSIGFCGRWVRQHNLEFIWFALLGLRWKVQLQGLTKFCRVGLGRLRGGIGERTPELKPELLVVAERPKAEALGYLQAMTTARQRQPRRFWLCQNDDNYNGKSKLQRQKQIPFGNDKQVQ